MTRALARITHDEVARMVKAVRSCGLHVTRVQYDGQKVDVFVAESVENIARPVDSPRADDAPIREPVA